MATICPRPARAWSEHLSEVLDLRIAADEAREPPLRRRLEPRPRCPRARQLENLDRVREPLHRDGPERLHLDVPLSEAYAFGGEPDRPRGGELLHPGREMGGLAHRRVVHAQIAADRADNDLPRVEADPDLDLHPVRAARVVGVALEGLLHSQRRVARSHGMILVGQRARRRAP